MRDYKFRGKRKGSPHEWIYGDLNHIDGRVYIFFRLSFNSPDWFEVDPESVGQYTDLKDKNGKEIYEGDIVRLTNSDNQIQRKSIVSEICFFDGGFSANWRKTQVWEGYNVSPSSAVFLNNIDKNQIEIIGNIHETN